MAPRTRRLRPAVPLAAALLAVAVLLGSLGAGCAGNRVIARVGKGVVRHSEWMRKLLREQGPEELLALVDDAIIRQEAAKLGVAPDEEATQAKIGEVVALMGSRSALEERLQSLRMSMDDLKRRAETLALLDAVVRKQVKVSQAEMMAYYQEHREEFRRGPTVRARLMLFTTKENADAVMAALKAGGDFAGLAKELSEDPGTKDAGGDTGWFDEGDYAPEISQMAAKLEPGQLSPVFQGPDGWYILRCEGKRPAGELSPQEAQDRIQNRLVQQKLLEERAKWLIQKRSEAIIVVKDRRLAKPLKAILATAPPPTPLPGLMTPDRMFLQTPPGPAGIGGPS